jgi:D-hydroxyproline dehydrogenase subunit gamma
MDQTMTTCDKAADRSPRQPGWLRRVEADNNAATTIVTVTIDGQQVAMREGDSVAAAVLLAGHRIYRTTIVDEAPRAPFCMMGICFDCLVEVDGIPNRQGCLLPVREGMRITRQFGLRAATTVAE